MFRSAASIPSTAANAASRHECRVRCPTRPDWTEQHNAWVTWTNILRLRTKASTLSRTRATTSSTTSATATSIFRDVVRLNLLAFFMNGLYAHLLQFPARVLGRGALRLPAVSVQLVGGAGARSLVSGPLVAARSECAAAATRLPAYRQPCHAPARGSVAPGRANSRSEPHPESARFAPAASFCRSALKCPRHHLAVSAPRLSFQAAMPLTENCWSIEQ